MLFLLCIGCIYCPGTSVGSSCEGAQGLGRSLSASGQAHTRSNTLKSNSHLEWQINRSRSKLMPNLEEPCIFERGSRISSHVWIDSEKSRMLQEGSRGDAHILWSALRKPHGSWNSQLPPPLFKFSPELNLTYEPMQHWKVDCYNEAVLRLQWPSYIVPVFKSSNVNVLI